MSFNYHANMLHNIAPPNPAFNANVIHPLTPSAHLTATNMPPSSAPDSIQTIPTGASSIQLVTVYRCLNSTGYIFQCNTSGCAVTFSRWHEFERHDNACHAGSSVLWCPMAGCSRSKKEGNKAFPGVRKDKMREHVWKIHGVKMDGEYSYEKGVKACCYGCGAFGGGMCEVLAWSGLIQ
jgi:hypothetical protein